MNTYNSMFKEIINNTQNWNVELQCKTRFQSCSKKMIAYEYLSSSV